MKLLRPAILLCFACSGVMAGNQQDTSIVRKKFSCVRITQPVKIDGKLDDAVWQDAPIATNFIQNSPKEGAAASYQTEVKMLYDNNALYIGAMMYDDHPDSIMKQMGLRDDNVTADNFRMVFDTYNTQQDAFDFTVTASNVQVDSRFSDFNYNAVWHSHVQMLPNGWSAEVEIPWSALRFPTTEKQNWGIQFTRWIQRKFEFDQWSLTPKAAQNSLKYWGILEGLENIDVPVRLSVTPYLSTIWQSDNRYGPDSPSTSFGGGMDLKYGINESFTLDMTLLPDFSQVQSDNIVKNLSPFEIQYDEYRPFFTEGTDLFSLGDLFYSRRIGKTPTQFYNTGDLLDSNERIIKNPTQSRLLNATKLSGRTSNGMGIGILNAYVDNTYAVAQDTLTGATRKILTEPRSNYNIFVFDKQVQNGSHVYFVNTNVMRTHGYRSADVSGAGFSLNNKKSTWTFSGFGAVSNIMEPVDSLKGQFNSSLGYKYVASIDKNSGKLKYGISRRELGKNFDPNDLGINYETNIADNSAYVAYNVYNPWWIFNLINSSLNFDYTQNARLHTMNNFTIDFFTYAEFRNFWSFYIGSESTPFDSKDYYEPREDGRFYLRTGYNAVYGGINTNSNKKISFNLGFHGGQTHYISQEIPVNPWGGADLTVNVRAGYRFSFSA
ncbi:MAG TPA: DUF5916 domain-containing protein, partial [Bacteroidia bacterium]|nr:DUF5916 domain-containing protein [Bacteroidia bacterium]